MRWATTEVLSKPNIKARAELTALAVSLRGGGCRVGAEKDLDVFASLQQRLREGLELIGCEVHL